MTGPCTGRAEPARLRAGCSERVEGMEAAHGGEPRWSVDADLCTIGRQPCAMRGRRARGGAVCLNTFLCS